jgi:hypothetical protein
VVKVAAVVGPTILIRHTPLKGEQGQEDILVLEEQVDNIVAVVTTTEVEALRQEQVAQGVVV